MRRKIGRDGKVVGNRSWKYAKERMLYLLLVGKVATRVGDGSASVYDHEWLYSQIENERIGVPLSARVYREPKSIILFL